MPAHSSINKTKAQFVGGRRRASPKSRRKVARENQMCDFNGLLDISINPIENIPIPPQTTNFQEHVVRGAFKSNRQFVQNPNQSMRNTHNIGQPRSTGGNH